jgi:hypothetical protein
MKTVRYTKFSYEVTEKGEINIKMNGQALGYRYIALQSDLFSEEKNLINPVFSNLTLDDKSNVNFDLSFSVDPSLVDYEEKLQREIKISEREGEEESVKEKLQKYQTIAKQIQEKEEQVRKNHFSN